MPTKVFDAFTRLDASDVNAYLANKSISNAVINGAMDIWQRGTTPTWVANNTSNFGPDRWYGISPAGRTVTRQPSGLAGFRFASRWQRTSGNTDTTAINVGQILASDDSIPFAGKTVTLSFYARRGANYSGGNFTATINSGTGTDQNYVFPGFSGGATVASQSFPLTTDWQRFTTVTGLVSSSATQLVVRFETGTLSGTAGTNDWFEITGVQLEEGTVANDFRRNGNSIQGELAACQRYYWRIGVGEVYSTYGIGVIASATSWQGMVNHPVPMRTKASSYDALNLAIYDPVSGVISAITTLTITSTQNTLNSSYFVAATSGFTGGRTGFVINANNSAGYLGIGAEL